MLNGYKWAHGTITAHVLMSLEACGILFMTPGMGVVNFSMYFCLSLCFLTSIDCYLNVTGVGLLLLNFIIINENL